MPLIPVDTNSRRVPKEVNNDDDEKSSREEPLEEDEDPQDWVDTCGVAGDRSAVFGGSAVRDGA